LEATKGIVVDKYTNYLNHHHFPLFNNAIDLKNYICNAFKHQS